MDNLARELEPQSDAERPRSEQHKLEIAHDRRLDRERDSLSENFADELDAWVRHALASNGFGGY